MNSQNIYRIGQTFRITEKPKNGMDTGRRLTLKIEKLYRRFALCTVNGKYKECFLYRDLAGAEELKGRS